MSIAIVLGTSRSDGNTSALANEFAQATGANVFPLSDFSILPFDYEFKNTSDDFLLLINQVIKHDIIIFASPIYWYSPSAQMKVFMDRLSDLLKLISHLEGSCVGKLPGCYLRAVTLCLKIVSNRYFAVPLNI
ncbi:NADPH-dependent FMN reductase [Shewanella denitrificans OS217]|uniref:NADPH-dependent FMN reductase n=1 Tax=Shewanella denitrificans (strain OS217 / ATCC BAA-1090 / DSM 15013) TaxID=318161 RepID=Q12P98_SHEDO|nr:NADPH-dependent FMN reductase [Shewanella denitrificans OS217]